MNNAKILINPINVGIGNDFRVSVSKVTDIEGNELDFLNTYIDIEWQDIAHKKYITKWNPSGNSINTRLINNKLILIFDNKKYRFTAPGKLKYRIHTRVADQDFSDGTLDVWSGIFTSDINLIRL